MARIKVSAVELRKRRRARELRRKRISEAEQGSDGANKGGDNVCTICDNGGDLVCCDGGCKRSFHLDESEGSTCRLALGLTIDEAKAILGTEEQFICKNCEYRHHQCFVCGQLGSSDLSSSSSSSSPPPEVFQCEHDDCGRFYHPNCAAKLLYPDGEEEAAALFEYQVAAGVGFACPAHECCVCRKGEDRHDADMQFAVCRRCPTTYHRKCLPKEILFSTKKTDPYGRKTMRRAWEDVLPDRVLIYCLNHDIVRKLGTPTRDHIVFPDAGKLGATKVPEHSPMEQDTPRQGDDEQQRHLFSEPSPSSHLLPATASNKNQRSSEGAELLGLRRPIVSGTSGSPPLGESNKNQCSCSGHMDSFAPKSLFMHPQPGSSCGWIEDDD